MRTINCLVVAVVALVATSAEAQSFRSMGFGENDSHTILFIRSDGSCVLTNQVTEARRSLEMQVTSWERFSKMSEGADDEDTANASPQPAKPAQKSFTSEELVAKVREMYQERPDAEEDEGVKIDTVEVSSNSVRLVTTRSYASLKELFSQNPYTWAPTALMFENARVETDTNRNLRITFTPNQAAVRYAKNMTREWKSAKMKFEWKLILPGKILNSGLPNTQETSTWLELNSDKPETLEAALKLMGTPLIITAESAGIKVDEPLESKKLVQAAWKQRGLATDLPVTEAGPGFIAEPVSISLSTIHYFPEGEKYFKDRPEASMFGMSSTGAVVSAKLFPPKGREIKSVSDARVKAAKDDRGRAIAGFSEAPEEQGEYTESVTYNSNESETGAARIELRLGLPAPDAKAIDELQCEAVALTIGSWKEMVLTNVQANAKKEFDLGEVLPGAKLTIKKITGRKPQKTVEATLEGPKEVSQIEVKIKQSSRRGGQSNMNERRSKTTGNKSTRNITVQAYEFDMSGAAESGPPTLIVRYPQDVKRERVQFKLTALDLL